MGRSRHVMNDVMNYNMAASAHFGARLGAFFYCIISLVNCYAVYMYENLFIAAEWILGWKFIRLFWNKV